MAKESGLSYAADRVWEATGIAVSVATPVVKSAAEPAIIWARFHGPRWGRIIAHDFYEEIYKKKG